MINQLSFCLLPDLMNAEGQADALTFLLLFSFYTAIAVTLLFFRSARKPEVPAEFGRMSNLGGRIEKMEEELNALRTETMRSGQLLKTDLDYLKRAVDELRGIKSGSSGGGSSGAGGASGAGTGGTETLTDSGPASTSSTKPFEHIADHGAVSETALSIKLKKTRLGLLGKLKNIFAAQPKLNPAMLEEVEAQLIASDLGIKTVSSLLNEAKIELAGGKDITEIDLIKLLKSKILEILGSEQIALQPVRRSDGPLVVMVVGVNGAGKTTTVAKLASQWKNQGANVLLVAADTFRAAAVEQLKTWGERIGVPVVFGAENSKPATVVFDAMKQAGSGNFDVVLIDTAGRLHTKSNLMQELEGIRGIIARYQTSAPHETILVVDGATGQNAVNQAREFNAAVPLSGLIVTKLDGTPKGGVVVAIKNELGLPVRYIGVGEGSEDLKLFNALEFVDALFDQNDISEASETVSAHAETRRRRREQDEPAQVH